MVPDILFIRCHKDVSGSRRGLLVERFQEGHSRVCGKCPNCQQVKVEHQTPGDLTKYTTIPTWKWEDVNVDLVVGLPCTQKQNDSI